MRRAASRADWTAGRSNEIRTAMIAMTTRSSIRVKPPDRLREKRRPIRQTPCMEKLHHHASVSAAEGGVVREVRARRIGSNHQEPTAHHAGDRRLADP